MNQIREIKEKYRVDEEGIIRKSGKYEGEMYYVPFFWEQRPPDEVNETEKVFKLSRKEQLSFLELGEIEELRITETNGAVQETSRA